MKNKMSFAFVAFIFSATFFSCSSGHKLSGVNLNGTWTLASIAFDGLPPNTKFTATLFDDVSYNCLTNSIWNLPNNGNGSYSVNSSDPTCNNGIRNIYWSVTNISGVTYLQFKHTDADKAKNVTAGYQLEVSSITSNAMILRAPIDFEGKTIYILYTFAKQ